MTFIQNGFVAPRRSLVHLRVGDADRVAQSAGVVAGPITIDGLDELFRRKFASATFLEAATDDGVVLLCVPRIVYRVDPLTKEVTPQALSRPDALA